MSVIVGVALTGTSNAAADQIFAAATSKRAGVTDLPPTASVHRPAAIGTSKTDSVVVSKQAEARLLYSQGQSAAQIEATLGLPSTVVTSYLGITNGVQTVTDAATAVVEAQIAQATPVNASTAIA